MNQIIFKNGLFRLRLQLTRPDKSLRVSQPEIHNFQRFHLGTKTTRGNISTTCWEQLHTGISWQPREAWPRSSGTRERAHVSRTPWSHRRMCVSRGQRPDQPQETACMFRNRYSGREASQSWLGADSAAKVACRLMRWNVISKYSAKTSIWWLAWQMFQNERISTMLLQALWGE